MTAPRKSAAALELAVDLSAPFAAAANQLGEESFYIAWAAKRALDAKGSGRLRREDATHLLRALWSAKQARRVLLDERACRWWEIERRFVRLRGQEDVLCSFDGVDLPSTTQSRRFRSSDLNTRPRRTAALVATVVGEVGPRSHAYINRFCGVDRNTLQRWEKDPFIVHNILRAHAEWAVE